MYTSGVWKSSLWKTLSGENQNTSPTRDASDLALAGQALESIPQIVDLGAGAALVKGGHLDRSHGGDHAESAVVDVLWDGDRETIWRRARIDTRHTHGTGCTLSAAITAGLARGRRAVGCGSGVFGCRDVSLPRFVPKMAVIGCGLRSS